MFDLEDALAQCFPITNDFIVSSLIALRQYCHNIHVQSDIISDLVYCILVLYDICCTGIELATSRILPLSMHNILCHDAGASRNCIVAKLKGALLEYGFIKQKELPFY